MYFWEWGLGKHISARGATITESARGAVATITESAGQNENEKNIILLTYI